MVYKIDQESILGLIIYSIQFLGRNSVENRTGLKFSHHLCTSVLRDHRKACRVSPITDFAKIQGNSHAQLLWHLPRFVCFDCSCHLFQGVDGLGRHSRCPQDDLNKLPSGRCSCLHAQHTFDQERYANFDVAQCCCRPASPRT